MDFEWFQTLEVNSYLLVDVGIFRCLNGEKNVLGFYIMFRSNSKFKFKKRDFKKMQENVLRISEIFFKVKMIRNNVCRS